jgi:hypothetical protein
MKFLITISSPQQQMEQKSWKLLESSNKKNKIEQNWFKEHKTTPKHKKYK